VPGNVPIRGLVIFADASKIPCHDAAKTGAVLSNILGSSAGKHSGHGINTS